LNISLALFPVMANSYSDATFTQSTISTCTGYPVNLNASGSVQNSVYWVLQGGSPSSSTSLTPTVTYSSAGTYPIKLYVWGGSCNNIDSMVTSITIAASPVPNATANPPTICNGQSSTLTAQNGTSYQWTGYPPSPNPQQVVSPSTTTPYVVTVTGSNGCSASQSVTVSVNQLPSANANANPTFICEGAGTFVTAQAGMTSYAWVPGGQTAATFWDYPTTTTTYTVLVTDGNGCQNTGSVQVTVDPCVGLESPVTSQGYTIFPNPTDGQMLLNLTKPREGAENLALYSASGMLVYRSDISRTSATHSVLLDLSGLAKGVYYLRINAYRQTFVRKIVLY
jgi:hypothetical protein